MGDPSDLRFVPASIANIPIDWSRVPEASKKKLCQNWGYDWENEVERPLPTTVADLAKWFDETKFFGYFEPSVCTILMDISEFGFPDYARQVGPRFYMKYLQQIWFLLFTPGKRDCIVGYSDDITDDEDREDGESERRAAAKEVGLAQEFDVKLEQDVLGGRASFVSFTKKLGGWNASMMEANLQFAQYVEAMLALPSGHPAQKALFSNMFG